MRPGGGGDIRITKKIALLLSYFYSMNKMRNLPRNLCYELGEYEKENSIRIKIKQGVVEQKQKDTVQRYKDIKRGNTNIDP